MSPEHFETLIAGGRKAEQKLTIDFAKSGGKAMLVERGMIGHSCSRMCGMEVSQ